MLLGDDDAGAAVPAAPMTQQDKMKGCSTNAGDRKGDGRKTFKADKKS